MSPIFRRTCSERSSPVSPARLIAPRVFGQQTTEHLDGGCLAGAIGSQQAVDLAVMDFQTKVTDGCKLSELFPKPVAADGNRVIGAALGRSCEEEGRC